MPAPFMLTNMMSELFGHHHHGHSGQLFSADRLPVAKIAPNDMIETGYGSRLKLSLFGHQLNNVEWMASIERQLAQVNESYSYVRHARLFEDIGASRQTGSISAPIHQPAV